MFHLEIEKNQQEPVLPLTFLSAQRLIIDLHNFRQKNKYESRHVKKKKISIYAIMAPLPHLESNESAFLLRAGKSLELVSAVNRIFSLCPSV